VLRRCLFALLLWTAAAAPSAGQTSVKIATEGAFPPFNMLGTGGEPEGFEVDLGRALCERAKLTCSFVVREWEGMVRDLVGGRYDAIMASLAITPRRAKRVLFSDPYYRIPAVFIGDKDESYGGVLPRDLVGKRIGTLERSDHAAFLEAFYPGADVRFFSKLEEANLDLATGRIDLVLGDQLALQRFLTMKEGACCRIVGQAPMELGIYGPGVGIGLRPDGQALKQAFDRALRAIIADGTYDRIRVRYFSFDTKPPAS
jgi:polar amino acid transport system substrate-binding protein